MAPQTAPEATQTGFLPKGSVRPGACSCGAPGLPECTCEWGRMIRDLIRAGYTLKAEEAAQGLPLLREEVGQTITAQRKKLLWVLAQNWQGSVNSFCDYFKISRAWFNRQGLVVPKDNRK